MTAAINEFVNSYGRTDVTRWRYDIIARLLVDMEEGGAGFSTNELCQIYFGFVDLEKKLWMGDQLQAVREMLQLRPTPLLLRNNQYRWYIVNPQDPGAARGFIQERTKRFIRAHHRLRTYSDIGKGTYALPEDDSLLLAIEGVTSNVQRLEDVVDQQPSLPSPEDDGNDDWDGPYDPDGDNDKVS